MAIWYKDIKYENISFLQKKEFHISVKMKFIPQNKKNVYHIIDKNLLQDIKLSTLLALTELL